MSAWIILTLCAAFLQNARSALQKDLKTALGKQGGGFAATFARFGFALPFAGAFAALVWLLEEAGGQGAPTWDWALLALIAAMAQLVATWTLLESFDYANFAIGTAFSKFESVFAAIMGAVFVAYAPAPLAIIGIAISLGGATLLTLKPGPERGATPRSDRLRAMAWGLLSAVFFAIAALGFRHASLALDGGSVIFRTAATLMLAIFLQGFIMGFWLRLRRRELWRATLAAWRPGLRIGAAGAAASACWFAAMTLEPAAHVRSLGQVELVFAVLTAWLFFREPPNRREIAGVALIGLGAGLLLLGAG